MSAWPALRLPVTPPYEPMEAKQAERLPAGDAWEYEPKWDGFRCIAFRDGPSVALQSKAGQPLARYFPELVEAVGAIEARRFVLDGEIVIERDGGLSFDDLLQRIHPAESRVRKLAAETPGTLLCFDMLVDERGEDCTGLALQDRRERLQEFAGKHLEGRRRVRLSPFTRSRDVLQEWQSELRGHGIDGIMAKRLDLPYRSGERDGMIKVKWLRTADCVVGGFRYGQGKKVVGSLLLGLYDDDGLLHHVGFCSTIPAAERASLTRRLESMVEPPGFTGRAPGGPSRWSAGRDTSWQPLAPTLVVEVRYDHFSGGRFRHGTALLRWRPEKSPRQCRMDQLGTGTGQ